MEYEVPKEDLAYAYCTSPFTKRFRSSKVNIIEYLDRLGRINNVTFVPFNREDWNELLQSVRIIESQVNSGGL